MAQKITCTTAVMNQWTVPLEWNGGMTLNPCENVALMVYDGSEGL